MQSTLTLQTSLYSFQQPAVDKLIKSRVGGLFMDMGLGKTRVAIELAYLRQNRISNVVWFTLVSLKETVRYEILKHTDAQTNDIYVFGDRTSIKRLPAASWYIIGLESLSSSDRITLTANHIINENSFVIVDESSYIKGHTSKRTRRITAMAQRAKYRLVITGTPMTQGVVDLFAQMRFLSEKILGYRSFYSFARNHLEYSKEHPGLIVRSHRTDYLAAKIAPYVYQVTKEEAGINLPAKLFDARYHSLTRQQAEAYDEAKTWLLERMLEEDFDDDLYIFQLFGALQQIVSGFWNKRFGPGDHRFYEYAETRSDLLMTTASGIPAGEKCIIWCKYRYSIAKLTGLLSAEYGADAVATFYGDLSEVERNGEIERWRQGARWLVATQSSGGHGLTLNEAAYAIYYENEFKWSHREQSEGRNHRIWQTRRPTYTDLWGNCGIERRIAKALAEKGDAADSFRREVKAAKDKSRKELNRFMKAL